MAPDWFVRAFIAWMRPPSTVRPELYLAADTKAASELWEYVSRSMGQSGTTAATRFPWVRDGNPNTHDIRANRWANRSTLYTHEEQQHILNQFPEMEQP